MKKFTVLTWSDLEEWAGSRIVDRGRRYQQQALVEDLSVLKDNALLAWVYGSEKYATKVAIDDDGLIVSTCSCPYEFDCKHAVAAVIEYLDRVQKNRSVPQAKPDDDRLNKLDEEYLDDDPGDDDKVISEDIREDIEQFLKSKTRAQLVDLIHDLANHYPDVATDLSDRKQLMSGDVKSMVTRLSREIQKISDEVGWQDYWRNEGFTPDYSGIRNKLKTLIDSGHADEALNLGDELVAVGLQQAEESHDGGETAMEVAGCMQIIVNALEQSSLDVAEKLNWALDAVLKDRFEICETFAAYLHRQHPKTAWHGLADRLVARLKRVKKTNKSDSFRCNYNRDRLSDWTIHALERSNREDEIIPLCIAEAGQTGSYNRLVERLVSARRFDDAERWIQEGIYKTRDKWPSIAAHLRGKLRDIRTIKKDWSVVAAIQIEEFVRRPSRGSFADCRKTAKRIKAWPKVRNHLLGYLEKGNLPWEQRDWFLPESGLDRPEPIGHKAFPLVNDLINIAIFEKKPGQVLKWYDQRSKNRFGFYGVDEGAVAIAVQTHAPERAVEIWKALAERLIARVKPKAYQEAARYLRKAAKIMTKNNKNMEWEQYLLDLREIHKRKRRLMEVLDTLNSQPILKALK